MALQQPQCRQVKNAVGTVQRAVEDVGLADIAAGVIDSNTRILQRASQVCPRAAYEIIVDGNLADVLANQQVKGVRADQASASDNDELLTSNVDDTPPLPTSGARSGSMILSCVALSSYRCAEEAQPLLGEAAETGSQS